MGLQGALLIQIFSVCAAGKCGNSGVRNWSETQEEFSQTKQRTQISGVL